jgi:hypothetical protein
MEGEGPRLQPFLGESFENRGKIGRIGGSHPEIDKGRLLHEFEAAISSFGDNSRQTFTTKIGPLA